MYNRHLANFSYQTVVIVTSAVLTALYTSIMHGQDTESDLVQAQSAKPSACHVTKPNQSLVYVHMRRCVRILIAHLLFGVTIASMELATKILRA